MAYLQDVYVANLNAVCHLGGEFLLPTDGTWAHREHSFVQNKFYFITGGRCRLTVDGKQYTGEEGMWFFIPAGTRHRYANIVGEPLHKFWIHFDLYPNADIAETLQLPHCVRVEKNDEAYGLFCRLIEANGSDAVTDRLDAKACLLQLLSRYVALAHPDGVEVSREDEERMQNLLAYIHEHLEESLGNERLAAQCHMHPTHFIRYFRGRTGQTPARYVTERRMEAAKRLLEETTLPVASIMERVGLQEPSHFARLFRKQFALTPAEYRRQYLAEQGKGSPLYNNV